MIAEDFGSVYTRGQKTREGAASAVRHRHDHRHRGQTSETQELFDADKRPGEKCGLEDIGCLDAVATEGFTVKHGATMSWGRDREPWSWYFRETNRRFPHAYQVWRGRFDQILLDHSRDCGAHVREGIGVKDVVFDGNRATGIVLDSGESVAAAMVVDATGQGSLIARKRDLKQWDPLFRNLAVYGYFRNCAHLGPPDDGNIFIESYAGGWLWKIPLAGGVSSIGAVVDRDAGAKAIRKAGLTRFLGDQIAAAPRTAALVGDASAIAPPKAVRDWSYSARTLTGPGWVLVGDAACFVDPLFSTGVHLAVTSAHIGAAYVVSALTDAGIAGEAAAAFERLYRTQYEHFHELARLFYAGNRAVDSYFWEARRITGEQRAPREAFVRAVSGQAAAGYERSVLSHGELPGDWSAALRAARPAPVETDLGAVRPILAPGLSLVSTTVLGDGRFERGQAIRGTNRIDLPVSPLVAQLVSRIQHGNGEHAVSTIAKDIAQRHGVPAERVAPVLLDATKLLLGDRILLLGAAEGRASPVEWSQDST